MKNIAKILIDAEMNHEPVFLLRAKDRCSVFAIEAYNSLCLDLGVGESQLRETQIIEDEFKRFQENNPDKVKLPD